MTPLRIFTWHIHGSYMYYLACRSPHHFYLPVTPDRTGGYGGRPGNAEWPDNVYEVPVEEVRRAQFDCILFQSRQHYEVDQYQIFSDSQRQLPRISYLEHDPSLRTPH